MTIENGTPKGLAELRIALVEGGQIQFACPPDEMLSRALISKALAMLEETLRQQQAPRVVPAVAFSRAPMPPI